MSAKQAEIEQLAGAFSSTVQPSNPQAVTVTETGTEAPPCFARYHLDALHVWAWTVHLGTTFQVCRCGQVRMGEAAEPDATPEEAAELLRQMHELAKRDAPGFDLPFSLTAPKAAPVPGRQSGLFDQERD